MIYLRIQAFDKKDIDPLLFEFKVNKQLLSEDPTSCTIIVPILFYARGQYATKESADNNDRWMGEECVSFVLLVSVPTTWTEQGDLGRGFAISCPRHGHKDESAKSKSA